MIIIEGLTKKWFTPESQEGEEFPLEVEVKPLTSSEMGEVSVFHKEGQVLPPGLLVAAQRAIVDWKNVQDEDGKKLKCNNFNIKKLPFEVLCEIGAQVLNFNEIGEEERKNS